MEGDETVIIPTSDHLFRVAQTLPTESYGQKLLKSYLLTKSQKMMSHRRESVRKELFDAGEMCVRCSTPYSDGGFTMKVDPIKMPIKRAKKIMRMQDDKSNPKKQKLAKKWTRKANNLITVECSFCKNKNRVSLWKSTTGFRTEQRQRKLDHSVRKLESQAVLNTPSSKSKKRDKTAGLLVTMDKASKQLKKIDPPPSTQGSRGVFTPKNNKKKQPSGSASKKPQIKLVSMQKPSLLQLAKALKAKRPDNSKSNDKLRNLLG